MKKMLTIVLALALVFSVAGSAFAFTGITEEETSAASKFTVKVELVDYNYGWKDGVYYKTPANRAYAINEVVGALVTVVVPAESNEKTTLKISQSNMKILDIDPDKLPEDGVTPSDDPNNFTLAANNTTSNKTYKFFVTAQLKSDKGGSITAKVKVKDYGDTIDWGAGIKVSGATGLEFTVQLSGYTYTIWPDDDGEYISDDHDALIIEVGRDYACKTMKLKVGPTTYTIATVNGKIAFKSGDNTYIVSGNQNYSELLDKLNEFLDEFGFDYNASGYLYKSFFVALDGSVTVSDTAYVEPALPSSALLPDLAVTIPQTGSVSFAGFAMIALAVAAAVAVKKAR